jgi:hypothetical protein
VIPPPDEQLPMHRTSGHVEGTRVDEQSAAWKNNITIITNDFVKIY